MLPFAPSRDVHTACSGTVLQDGGVAEAGRLLVARLPRRCLVLLCTLQALFSFIRNSLEMHIAMA